MNKTNEFEEVEEVADAPVSAALQVLRPKRYGSVEGLDDSELADIHELQRLIFEREWGPILALPVRKQGRWIKPNIDENGDADYGAFATVDFAKLVSFDKARYKIEMLGEEIRHDLIMADTIKDRLPGNAKYVVLKHVMKGLLQLDDIVSEDMRALAKLYLQVQKKQRQIGRIQAARKAEQERKLKAFLEA